ncbi:hypothetical protein EW146_g1562 [Bondarzewia mesenterica]|uniref:Uncharacterized protein n=1 Tax=Bondarzewia mesenterica TaxID=1095465 RepID=A0A4S4M3X3_9AGAM|nr:hypothetical protein EW146_g1562 [Bondarzewia mesenterica]
MHASPATSRVSASLFAVWFETVNDVGDLVSCEYPPRVLPCVENMLPPHLSSPDRDFLILDSRSRLASSKSSPVRRNSPAVTTARANAAEPDPLKDPFLSGVLTSQSSQQFSGMEAARSLISPPPEDNVRQVSKHSSTRWRSEPAQRSLSPPARSRSPNRPITNSHSPSDRGESSKRKRTWASTSRMAHEDIHEFRPPEDDDHAIEATPNPKPRKQKRHTRAVSPESSTRQSITPRQSHHRSGSPSKSISPTKPTLVQSLPRNANADDIPLFPIPIPSHAHRFRPRSSTPIPSYEPPNERFTPPREVILTPSPSMAKVSKSSKRKFMSAKPNKVLKLLIKKEPPDIDLSKPAPPPSPTDDPLLLRGGVRRKKPLMVAVSPTVANARDTPSIASTSPPEAAPQAFLSTRFVLSQPDFELPSVVSDSDELPGPPSMFDFTGADDVDDESSEEERERGKGDEEDTGEYTGRFKVMTVPIKADPPTSATRDRIERWGRPRSPFPLRNKVVEEDDEEEDGDQDMENDTGEDLHSESTTGPANQKEERQETKEGNEPSAVEEDGLRPEQRSTADDSPPMQDEPSAPHELYSAEPLEDDIPTPESPVLHPDDHVDDVPPMELVREDESGLEDVDMHGSHDPAVDASVEGGEPAVDTSVENAELSADEVREDDAGPAMHQPAQETDSGFQDGSVNPEEAGDVTETPLVQQAEQTEEGDDNQGERDQEVSFMSDPDIVQREKSVEEEEVEEETSVDRELSVDPEAWKEKWPSEEVVEQPENDEVMGDVQDEDEASSSDGESNEGDQSVIKIVSDDPWAAARAAAILKSHDYDMIVKDLQERRRSSPSVQSLMKNARRADVSASGIRKSVSPARKARYSLGATIGDRMFIPGTPSASLFYHGLQGTPVKSTTARYPLRTPSPAASSFGSSETTLHIDMDGPRDWTRNDWKLLDACFTDERLAISARLGKGGDELGDVDLVDLEKVADRFVVLLGGENVVAGLGSAWTRLDFFKCSSDSVSSHKVFVLLCSEDLLRRARALQKKQRSGNVAPPTPSFRQSSVVSTPSVPDFTPLSRGRFVWSSSRPKLSAPALSSWDMDVDRPKLPPSLLAPRYSHLMEEAISISRQEPPARPSVDETSVNDISETSMSSQDISVSEDMNKEQSEQAPAGIGSRVKGFFFSYLPTLSKSKVPVKTKEGGRPGLPLPPPEVLEKARGPITTPISKPPPKQAHPKEIVNLHRAPVPPSKIPRMQIRPRPRRLVDLRHVTLQPEPPQPIRIPQQRRSSGGSVKDLVRSFEEMDNLASDGRPVSQMTFNKQNSAAGSNANPTTPS